MKKLIWAVVLMLIILLIVLLITRSGKRATPVPTGTVSTYSSPDVTERATSTIAGKLDYLPTTVLGKVVEHDYFTLSYVEKYEQAEWVAYELTREETEGNAERLSRFTPDPLVKTGSPKHDDYTRSGYDRGHMAPAADMQFSEEAMAQCFYTSNISPQNPHLNRETWRLLEEKTRDWAKENDGLFIVTGPVLSSIKGYISTDSIAIPTAYYKILVDYKEPEIKAIAFLLPNEETERGFMDYVVTIDSVEQLTHINFFTNLPKDQEKTLEGTLMTTNWK